jgi:hypothetical protein
MAIFPSKLQQLPCRSRRRLIDLARKVGLNWIERLGRLDRRRPKVKELNTFLAERLAAGDESLSALDTLRTLLCANCARLHPDLATLCTMQPEVSNEKLDRCWLLKGSHCEISGQWWTSRRNRHLIPAA